MKILLKKSVAGVNSFDAFSIRCSDKLNLKNQFAILKAVEKCRQSLANFQY